jgi:hypothetical protein
VRIKEGILKSHLLLQQVGPLSVVDRSGIVVNGPCTFDFSVLWLTIPHDPLQTPLFDFSDWMTEARMSNLVTAIRPTVTSLLIVKG